MFASSLIRSAGEKIRVSLIDESERVEYLRIDSYIQPTETEIRSQLINESKRVNIFAGFLYSV